MRTVDIGVRQVFDVTGKALTETVIQGRFTDNLEEGLDNASGQLAIEAEKPAPYGKRKEIRNGIIDRLLLSGR